MRNLVMIVTLVLALALAGCANGPGPSNPARETTAKVVTGVLGGPGILIGALDGVYLNFVSLLGAWISGVPKEGSDVPVWFSMHFGPTYASVNNPLCWLYFGFEPEDRELAQDLAAGTHIRQIPLRALDYENPPAMTACRTGIWQNNLRGDESFDVVQ